MGKHGATCDQTDRSASHDAEEVVIRSWRPGDTPAINAFYNDPAIRPAAGAKGAAPRSEEQWAWEFSPRGLAPTGYGIATSGDRIVGIQAYIPLTMRFGNERVLTGKDEDTLVHPDYRGRGILDRLYELIIERAEQGGVAMLWGFTNTAVRPLLRNGFRSLGTFDSMTLSIGSDCDRISARGTDALTGGCEVTVEEIRSPDARMDQFADLFASQSGGMGLDLSADFLRWRVFENPFRAYKVFAAVEGGDIVGLGIFKAEPQRRTGFVSDLAALSDAGPGMRAIQCGLLAAGIEYFKSLGFSIVEARAAGDHRYNRELRSLLADVGFNRVTVANPPEFLVRPVAMDSPAVLDMANWRICELMREY